MRLLVTGAWKCTDDQINELALLGNDVVFMQNEADELPLDPELVEGVICNGLFLHHDISDFKNLRYIQLTSAGVDRIPMEYINAKGIIVKNARGVYSIPMAEFAVSGVLQLYKECKFFYRNQKIHNWEKNRNLEELFGKTVCIVGCGSVGTECARRFSAFGCKILGVDLFPRTDCCFEKIYHLNELDIVLNDSQVLILTLPLTDETRNIIDKIRLNMLPEGAVVVNISRGGVVDSQALLECLREQKLKGAVMDVFEQEPLNEKSEFWDLDNVILTPHNSFVGSGNSQRLWEVIKTNMEKER